MSDYDNGIRILSLLTHRPELDENQFQHHWRAVHAPLVAALPNLRTYRQYDVLDELRRPGRDLSGAPIHGVAELVFDSWTERQAAYASNAGVALMADGTNFVLGARSLRVQRRTIFERD